MSKNWEHDLLRSLLRKSGKVASFSHSWTCVMQHITFYAFDFKKKLYIGKSLKFLSVSLMRQESQISIIKMLHFNASCNKMKSHYNFRVSCKTNCKVTIKNCLYLHNLILNLIQSAYQCYHYVLYVYHDFRLSFIIFSE